MAEVPPVVSQSEVSAASHSAAPSAAPMAPVVNDAPPPQTGIPTQSHSEALIPSQPAAPISAAVAPTVISGPSRASQAAVVPHSSMYRNNVGIMEGLFNKLKVAAGFGDPFTTYYPGNAFVQPFIPQANMQIPLIADDNIMKPQAIAPTLSIPMNPALGMTPVNHYQQQQQLQQAQQLLMLLMMNQQQQHPYVYQQQLQLQQQQMLVNYFIQQQQQQAAMVAAAQRSEMMYPATIMNTYSQYHMPYYPQYQHRTYPYEDYTRSYYNPSYYDTRHRASSFYPQRTRNFSSVKDLRPY
ncbi:hypothetical protein RMATCC62417_12453 [Rhizopus microsporus]|nr:hypothetical protein RMATCC62417_12453 [Rhizopus microsporus]